MCKIIALYLPQYHPTKENDEWWGPGFTEWTNVGKAKPLFKGHYQPKVPKDLGYYDLRLHESRIAQAELANKFGVDGFCYYHYRFAKGKKLLEKPFEEVLTSGKPDFPFMLCWANESWHRKFWSADKVVGKETLVEQTYGGTEDFTEHFYELLPAFKDSRYIKIHDKPAFMVYKPLEIPSVVDFIALWNELALENGLKGIHFIGHSLDAEKEKDSILDAGFDAVNSNRLLNARDKSHSKFKAFTAKVLRRIFNLPFILSYKSVLENLTHKEDYEQIVYPCILPNWDHTPRSGRQGFLLHNSTPSLFGKHIKNVFDAIKLKPIDDQICFIKSWNEWGEGNYMEPDMKYGTAYLEELLKIRKSHFN